MTTIALTDVPLDLPALLERVTQGEQFTLTRQGVPVACLVPAPEEENEENIVAKMRALRKGVRLDGLTIREMLEEGRSAE